MGKQIESIMFTLSLARRGLFNYLSRRPLSVSFEVTYSCNARCKHCHLGGIIKNEDLAPPERYGELARQFKPVVAQISGGEPLLRKDVTEIVKAIKNPRGAASLAITTNARLLTLEKFHNLREAGVDRFSVSLDYPDERHDEFRGVKGLFNHIESLVAELGKVDAKAIMLSCVVQKDNFRELVRLAELSQDWGVRINFSTYTHLRTQDREYLLDKDDLDEFRNIIKKLMVFREENNNFFASEYNFQRMLRFFEQGGIGNCKSGDRFFIVNPDGTLSPCGLKLKYYDTLDQMRRDFVKSNRCNQCNTSIRANSEKPTRFHLLEHLQGS